MICQESTTRDDAGNVIPCYPSINVGPAFRSCAGSKKNADLREVGVSFHPPLSGTPGMDDPGGFCLPVFSGRQSYAVRFVESMYSTIFSPSFFTVYSKRSSSGSSSVRRNPRSGVKNDVSGTTQMPVEPSR